MVVEIQSRLTQSGCLEIQGMTVEKRARLHDSAEKEE